MYYQALKSLSYTASPSQRPLNLHSDYPSDTTTKITHNTVNSKILQLSLSCRALYFCSNVLIWKLAKQCYKIQGYYIQINKVGLQIKLYSPCHNLYIAVQFVHLLLFIHESTSGLHASSIHHSRHHSIELPHCRLLEKDVMSVMEIKRVHFHRCYSPPQLIISDRVWVLCCLMTAGLSNDMLCHVWPYSFLWLQSPDQTSGHT